MKRCLYDRRDSYPYEFSYASGYIFMTESICWEPRGGQRLIALYRAGPLLFFLAPFVFGDSRAPHYSLSFHIGSAHIAGIGACATRT